MSSKGQSDSDAVVFFAKFALVDESTAAAHKSARTSATTSASAGAGTRDLTVPST